MAKEYSNVHKQPNYWNIRYDEWNGRENAHIVATQGDREYQIYLQTLEPRHQNGSFSSDEIAELMDIARKYKDKYNL